MKVIYFFLCFLITGTIAAQIELGAPFTDHMVLQRNSSTSIWGWSEKENTPIEIKVSWNNEVYTTQSNSFGKWTLQIPTPEAGGPFEIIINNDLKLQDVLIGEVWLCSGQSNMDWTAQAGIDNAQSVIQESENNQIRFFSVPKNKADTLQENCDGEWLLCNPETMPSFSAVAYFFGKELQATLNVPIGLIHSAWGGTAAEVWTPEPVISADKEFSTWGKYFPKSEGHPTRPGELYNTMIYPLVPFNIAGVIWYQGESNTVNPVVYRRLFPAMIDSWRDAWGKNFPFYYVQIAPFNYAQSMTGTLVREAQLMTMTHEKVGMVVIDDIGNVEDIHPRNKEDVGKRLAFWALNKNYNKDISYSGPIYKSSKKRGTSLILDFQYSDGLHIKGGRVEELFIAGANGIFYPAVAKIENSALVVNHSKVEEPESVRYAFSNTATGNLFNGANLPASSFRTDDWPIILRPVEITLTQNGQKTIVQLHTENRLDEIRYTFDGIVPGPKSNRYTGPISLDSSAHIKARAVVNKRFSEAISEKEIVLHKAIFAPVQLANNYNSLYASSGNNALTDALKGGLIFNDGNWQGYQKADVVATIDLGNVKTINYIQTHFLRDQNSWIFLPEEVKFSISENGLDFTTVYTQEHVISPKKETMIQTYTKKITDTKARYIRIRAKNVGSCPEWHKGSGGGAWLFLDEVVVE